MVRRNNMLKNVLGGEVVYENNFIPKVGDLIE